MNQELLKGIRVIALFGYNKLMRSVNVVLMGFGKVGRAFLAIVGEKKSHCQERYGLDIRFPAIFDLGGALVYSSFLEAGEILESLSSGHPLSKNPYWKADFKLIQALESIEPGVLIECTPSNIKTGESGLTHIRQALERGWHVVTANKGPLVVDFRGLREMAERNKLALKFSGATAAALPTLDLALYSLAGAEILGIEGILNGTTNFILTKMKEGEGYDEALREAQEKGIAESDPSLDLGGWDTAAKLLLITNTALKRDFTMNDVRVEGITSISPRLLRQGREEGTTLKLLGKMWRQRERFHLEVALTIIDESHPLYGVDGTNKGITFMTDTMDAITVIGGKSDPRGAGAALLKDLINIYRKT